MMQTGRVRVEAGNVTFVVQHELWDGNIQDHSDQGVVILVEVGDATALRFNCFDRERSYVYGPGGKDVKFRMDETVDGNPIGWSVKTLRNSIGIMLTEAGYGEAAGAVDMAAVNKALDEVEETARYKFAAERNTVKHNRGTDVFEAGQHQVRAGEPQAGLGRRRRGHPRAGGPGGQHGPRVHRGDRAAGLRLLLGRPALPLWPPQQEPPHLLGQDAGSRPAGLVPGPVQGQEAEGDAGARRVSGRGRRPGRRRHRVGHSRRSRPVPAEMEAGGIPAEVTPNLVQ